MEKPLGTMPQLQLTRFVSPWSPAPPPLPCFLCSWWGMVKSRCRFTLSSSCLATSPRGRAGPWEGSTVKPHTLNHTASITHLQAFEVPLNRTFESFRASWRESAAKLLGWQSWVYTDGRVSRDHRTNTSNQPISHFWKKEKGMAGAGQSKHALENLKLWAGIFSCSYSFHTHFGEPAPLRKAEPYFLGSASYRKRAVHSQSQNKHCFQQHQQSFPGTWAFSGG